MDASTHPFFFAAIVVTAIAFASLGIWRFFERPVQRWSKAMLTTAATRLGATTKRALAGA